MLLKRQQLSSLQLGGVRVNLDKLARREREREKRQQVARTCTLSASASSSGSPAAATCALFFPSRSPVARRNNCAAEPPDALRPKSRVALNKAARLLLFRQSNSKQRDFAARPNSSWRRRPNQVAGDEEEATRRATQFFALAAKSIHRARLDSLTWQVCVCVCWPERRDASLSARRQH